MEIDYCINNLLFASELHGNIIIDDDKVFLRLEHSFLTV